MWYKTALLLKLICTAEYIKLINALGCDWVKRVGTKWI